MNVRRIGAVAGSAVFLLVASGCSDDVAENLAERATEEAIENSGGDSGDVDIDFDNGEVNIEGEDGESVSIGSGDLPDGFPSEIFLPDGFDPQSSFTGGDDSGSGGSVTLLGDGDVEEIYADAQSEMEDNGFDITNTSEFTSDGAFTGTFAFSGHDLEGTYSVSDTGADEGDNVSVAIFYGEAQG